MSSLCEEKEIMFSATGMSNEAILHTFVPEIFEVMVVAYTAEELEKMPVDSVGTCLTCGDICYEVKRKNRINKKLWVEWDEKEKTIMCYGCWKKI